MKTLSLIALSLLLGSRARADFIAVNGAKAEAIINALQTLGVNKIDMAEFFQVGVSACSEVHDDAGNYQGEACMIYGDSDENDPDDVLRSQALIPSDDPDLSHNPDLKAKMEKLRAVRLSLDGIVLPLVKTGTADGKEVVLSRTSGIAGLACDGYSPGHVLQCTVKTSSLCPPRSGAPTRLSKVWSL